MSANTALMNERPLVDMFHPPERLLMGAGPSRVHEDVLKVMSQTTIGHLDPDMITMMDQLKDMPTLYFSDK
jgi:alanine-glyoxylate transaminase/serine-glyoxylate transaminase/serine-pyruvate transaminase